MMEIKFNLAGAERKPLVEAVSEIVGSKATYMRAPTYGYEVQGYTIDKNGTLICDERTDSGVVHSLLSELVARGFVYEDIADEATATESASGEEHSETCGISDAGILPEDSGADTDSVALPGEAALAGDAAVDEYSEIGGTPDDALFPEDSGADANSHSLPGEIAAPTDAPDRLVVEVPLDGFTATALDNLDKLVASKADLIKKSLGASDLPIVREDDRLCFPWFTLGASEGEVAVYTQFVHKLCEMAKKQKRVVAKEKPAESEKFAFRCFLLRLGYIGHEYGAARKLLLANLPGDGSFKSGKRKERDEDSGAVTPAPNAAASGFADEDESSAGEDGSAADSAAIGGVEGASDPNSLAEALADAELIHGINALFDADLV